MTTIFVRDDLRASVEAATGGAVTVLYTAKGQPSYMSVVPQFTLQSIDPSLGTGIHPAFVVNGIARPEVFIGTYQGSIRNGELLSLPGVDPAHSLNHDAFAALGRASGPGWHLTSNVEWAALALWCWRNGHLPRGNTAWGASSDSGWETGRRVDGLAPGLASGAGRTLTGSGPAAWRHNNAHSGISDLSGNVWEWTPGMRVVGGEIQLIENNNSALFSVADLGPTSGHWRAIDGNTGALIQPTFTGSIAGADYTPTTPNSVRYAASGTANHTLVRASGASFEGMTNPGATPVAAAALAVLRSHALFPIAGSGLGADGFWVDPAGERLPVRGGTWDNGAGGGVFALLLGIARSHANWHLGSRPAFVP